MCLECGEYLRIGRTNPRIFSQDLLSPLRGGAVVGEQGLQSAAMRTLDLDMSGQNVVQLHIYIYTHDIYRYIHTYILHNLLHIYIFMYVHITYMYIYTHIYIISIYQENSWHLNFSWILFSRFWSFRWAGRGALSAHGDRNARDFHARGWAWWLGAWDGWGLNG